MFPSECKQTIDPIEEKWQTGEWSGTGNTSQLDVPIPDSPIPNKRLDSDSEGFVRGFRMRIFRDQGFDWGWLRIG